MRNIYQKLFIKEIRFFGIRSSPNMVDSDNDVTKSVLVPNKCLDFCVGDSSFR